MSAPYRHTCGTTVEARTARTGWDFSIVFYHHVTGAPVEHCPGCHASLRDALRDGDLTDECGRRTYPDRAHEAKS